MSQLTEHMVHCLHIHKICKLSIIQQFMYFLNYIAQVNSNLRQQDLPNGHSDAKIKADLGIPISATVG